MTLRLQRIAVLLVFFAGLGTAAYAQSPTITSLSPTSGSTSGGTSVQIDGTNLNTVTSATFGGTAATILGALPDGTQMFVQTPAHAAGAVDVVVTNPSGSFTAPGAFTYLAPLGPAPTVTGVSPDKGTTIGGTAVTITGTDFAANATVAFGSQNATDVVVVNDTTITAVTPGTLGGQSQAVTVTVTNTDGQFGGLPNGFTYSSLCDSTITSKCVSSLLVNGGAAPGSVGVEMFASGDTGVQFSIVNSSNSDRFELTPDVTATDLITLVFKADGAADPVIALSTGEIQSWQWNGTTEEATVVFSPSASSWSMAGCNLPPGTCAPQASVDYSALALLVLGAPPDLDADVAALFQGSFFSTNAQVFSNPSYDSATSAVSFLAGAPSLRADGVTENDNGAYRFMMTNAFITDATNGWNVSNPADLLDPNKSKVTIGGDVVTPSISEVAATAFSPAGILFEFDGFHYSVQEIAMVVAPTVTGISPNSGPTAGGTNFTLSGVNFRAGATVSIGGVPATGLTVVNDTTITGVTGVHAAGAVDVVVTNTDATSDTLAGGFTYVGATAPGAFVKSNPLNGALGRPTSLLFGWGASTGATGYEYCIDTTNDNTCAGAWTSAGTSTSANVTGLTTSQVYYWQVRATNTDGTTEADGGTWWSFTTGATAGVGSRGDIDGDGKADIAVFRPSDGGWYFLKSAGGASGVGWGTNGDTPVAGDYDGDGTVDVAVFRPSDGGWYIVRSSGGAVGVGWGAATDTPVPADYDGDGKTDVAVFRPSDGGWYVVRSGGGATGVGWGTMNDVPVPADYDGDGKADVAVFRPSDGGWYIVKSGGGATGLAWGAMGDTPVVADYDGDGKADVGVFRASESAWYIVYSGGGAAGFTWGTTGDQPVVADYDGDGKADVAVFRPSDGGWYILKSSGGSLGLAWGASGDIPITPR